MQFLTSSPNLWGQLTSKTRPSQAPVLCLELHTKNSCGAILFWIRCEGATLLNRDAVGYLPAGDDAIGDSSADDTAEVGLIAGSVVGSLLCLTVIILVVVFCCYRYAQSLYFLCHSYNVINVCNIKIINVSYFHKYHKTKRIKSFVVFLNTYRLSQRCIL